MFYQKDSRTTTKMASYQFSASTPRHNGVQLEAAHNPSKYQPSEEFPGFSAEYLKQVEEVLTCPEDSASYIAFWSTQPINPATYFQMEVARRAESKRQKELELQRQNILRAKELRAKVIANAENKRTLQWILEEQNLTYEQRQGYAYVAEEDVEKMREAAENAWNSEESDRIYDLTLYLQMQYFLDAESWSENLQSYWSEEGLVTYIPEPCSWIRVQ